MTTMYAIEHADGDRVFAGRNAPTQFVTDE